MASSTESPFVSAWVKENRRPIRKCTESGCGGSVYWNRCQFKGDADWAMHQCDRCGAGWESAGHWSYPIPQQIKRDDGEGKRTVSRGLTRPPGATA